MSQSELFSLLTNKNKSTVKETHTQDSFFFLSYTIEETGLSLSLFLFLYSMKAYYIIRRAREEEEKKRAMKIVFLSLSLSTSLYVDTKRSIMT